MWGPEPELVTGFAAPAGHRRVRRGQLGGVRSVHRSVQTASSARGSEGAERYGRTDEKGMGSAVEPGATCRVSIRILPIPPAVARYFSSLLSPLGDSLVVSVAQSYPWLSRLLNLTTGSGMVSTDSEEHEARRVGTNPASG